MTEQKDFLGWCTKELISESIAEQVEELRCKNHRNKHLHINLMSTLGEDMKISC